MTEEIKIWEKMKFEHRMRMKLTNPTIPRRITIKRTRIHEVLERELIGTNIDCFCSIGRGGRGGFRRGRGKALCYCSSFSSISAS